MATYFFRRILLMIPTFLGSTVLVFTILQMAPGGPIEQIMLQMQMGGAVAAEGGSSSSSMIGDGGGLPPEALKELERFYGFDKPIYQRYLSWLGIWPREIKHRDFSLLSKQSIHEKRVGKKDGKIWKVDIKIIDNRFEVFEKNGDKSAIWFAKIEKRNENGSIDAVIFQ